MADYSKLIGAIVKKQINVIGREMALKVAKDAGANVDENGNVSGGNKKDLQKLIAGYKKIGGDAFLIFAKAAIKPLLEGDEDLPEDLK